MIHRVLFPVLAVVVAMIVCSRAAAQDEKLDLRLRLKHGATYRVKTTVEQRINQSGGGKQQATEQTFGVVYAMTVADVDAGGNMKVATKYEAVNFRQKGPAGVVTYDSAKEPKQVAQAARPFAALVGLGFGMTITPAGRVTAVEGLDAMFDGMIQKLDLAPGPQRETVRKVLTEQFGEEAMKQNLQNLFAIYPEQPVAVGESWRRRVVVTKGFPVTIDATYALEQRDAGVATLGVNATLTPNEAAGPLELGTGKMSYDLKGELSGTARVDEATGWTKSLTTSQLMSGTLRFQGAGGVPEVVNPVTINEKVTLEAVQ